jgi:hypothetical protein
LAVEPIYGRFAAVAIPSGELKSGGIADKRDKIDYFVTMTDRPEESSTPLAAVRDTKGLEALIGRAGRALESAFLRRSRHGDQGGRDMVLPWYADWSGTAGAALFHGA